MCYIKITSYFRVYMQISELFKINQPLVPYSDQRVSDQIKNYNSTWTEFLSTDKVIVYRSQRKLDKEYFIPFCKVDNNIQPPTGLNPPEGFSPCGYIELHHLRILFDPKNDNVYTVKSECVTPHIRLSSDLRGTGLATVIYNKVLAEGKTLVTSSHTIEAEKLWNKIGNVKYVRLPKGRERPQLKEVPVDDKNTIFKVILGSGKTLSNI